MDLKQILKDIDGKIAYYSCVDLFKDMSKVSDINSFLQIMEQKKEMKTKIEEGLIYLVSKKELEDFEYIFLDKYHKYLGYILEQDTREYYNNKYCSYLFSKMLNNVSSEDDLDNAKFINGKTLDYIDNLLVDKHNQLMQKVINEEELDDNDRKFLEESFLSTVFDGVIYKEIEGKKDVIYDVVDYFSKYPIEDISTARNKQLYILSYLSSQLLQIKSNCAIKFVSDTIIDDKGKQILGGFGIIKEDSIPYIKISDLGIYSLKSEKEFIDKMFTLFHELEHFRQLVDINEFNDEVKKIILMENDMTKTHRDFYKKHHDSFLIERDADNYASIEIIKEFGEKYPIIVNDIVSREQNRKRIEPSIFYQMEMEEYNNNSVDNYKKK